LLAVGERNELDEMRRLVGRKSELDLRHANGKVMSKKIFVTRKNILGKTLAELDLPGNFGVVPTRLLRGDIEFSAAANVHLLFGDQLQIVGSPAALDEVADLAGNQSHAVRDTNFLPIFLGIGLGILAGLIPLKIPGVPVPVRMGMAGGPLILAILLGRLGRIGPLIWYMPPQANAALREFGIILFLGCVGLKAGAKFFSTVFSVEGAHWLVAGLIITVVPLIFAALFARLVFKFDFPTISGVISGSMTDPPALAFAHALVKSEAPLVAYATVYPLAMLLRIFTVQILVLLTIK
jgi:putative transport protein